MVFLFVAAEISLSCPEKCICKINRQITVHCSSKKLTKIPSDIPTQTILLDLEANDLRYIKPKVFQHLTNLKQLLLSDTNLTVISAHAFHGLHNLKCLSLNINRITSLDEDTFLPLKNLEYLDLASNIISGIHTYAFRGLKNLKGLSLLNNSITHLRNGFLGTLPKLEKLDVSENSFHFIDEKIFSNLTKLTRLKLRDNNIAAIHPNAMSGLNSIERLDLSGNKISRLKSGLFKDLLNLKELRLNDNSLEHLGSSTFLGLRRLDILHLENNSLTHINENAFSHLELLRGLFLELNNLTAITSCMLNGLRALTVLDVSFNQLASIAEDAFTATRGLVDIYLKHNKITSINEHTFSFLTMLSVLNLSNNRIRDMIPFNFHRMKDLNMLGNRIDCNCQQLSLAMSLNAQMQFSTCVLTSNDRINYLNNPSKTFLPIPSFVYSAEVQWSNWVALPAYAVNSTSTETKIRNCDYGIRIRTRKCVSCSEMHRPWCVTDIPSPRERCVSFQAKKYQTHQSNLCRLSGCPERIENSQPNKTKSPLKYTQRCKFDANKGREWTGINPTMLSVIISTSCVVCILAFVWIRKVRICRGANETVDVVEPVGDVVGCELQEQSARE